jgi:hypothetical protein
VANQISITFTGTATYGDNFREQIQPGTTTITLSGQGFASGIQAIGTSAEDLDIGDIGAANVGKVYLRNLDTTNFVTYGLNDSATLKAIGKLKPGEWAWFRIKPSAALMLQADTAACNVQYKLFRD